MNRPTAVIIGAGIGGVAAAIRLQIKGYAVQVFENLESPGGKLAEFRMQDYRFDKGPSLFTLPEQVDELFKLAGKEPSTYFSYEKLDVITRYFYPDGTQIQAYSDPKAFAQEIANQTSESSINVLNLLTKGAELYDITSHVFLERSLHKLGTYLRLDTLKSILRVHRLNAFQTMNHANEDDFTDPKVIQLFNRYATYNGSDPYQAPATLNIIPHLEHNLGAYFPKKGMYEIVRSLFQLAEELGVEFHFQKKAQEIILNHKKVAGVKIEGQSNVVPAEIVVSNADIVPTYRRLLPNVQPPERLLNQPRSSSALIFYWGIQRTFPELELHNIFFTEDYPVEFEHIWKQKALCNDPTVYVYISSKRNPKDAPKNHENWFVMINTPHIENQDWDKLIMNARKNIIAKLSSMLKTDIDSLITCEEILDPRDIESQTSAHLGALYGNSSNNPFAAFLRHPNFSRSIKGLYFCGGSVHPGGGIPLCLLSAKIVGDLVKPIQ